MILRTPVVVMMRTGLRGDSRGDDSNSVPRLIVLALVDRYFFAFSLFRNETLASPC